MEMSMADGGDGFVGRCEVVEPRRGNRRWPNDLKARIVARSFQPGARVVDVARRHGIVAHQPFDWRRFARQGLLRLPAELLPASPPTNFSLGLSAEPSFVPLLVGPEPVVLAETRCVPEVAEAPTGIVPLGIMTVEIGLHVVLRVLGDVTVERAAALVRARGTSARAGGGVLQVPSCLMT